MARRSPIGRRFRRLSFAALIGAASLVGSTTSARAGLVERVVAVVGERAILLSDVKDRAKPFLVKIHQELPAGAQRNAAISQTYKNVLERMVDEELQQRAANRSKIVIDAREVDDAISRVAAQNNLTVDKLVAEARRTGLDERQYRQEIRRQVLEAKLLNLRVQGRIRVTEEDLRSMYRRMLLDERKKLGFRAAWIRLDLPSSDKKLLAARRALAESLSETARSGDFAALAKQHSDDTATRDRGGQLPRLEPGKLPRALDLALLGLEVGQVTPALRVGDSFFVLKLLERDESELPTFAEAKDELGERVYLEKMAKARKSWMDSLRKQTHLEIRL